MRMILNFFKAFTRLCIGFFYWVTCGRIDSFGSLFYRNPSPFIGGYARGLGLLARA
jgi:hypothetical protein